MENNSAKIKHKCPLCKYDTFRRFDLKRHQNSKHPVYEPPEINVPPNLQNVPSEPNNGFLCIKCNKKYKVKKI